MRGEIAVDYLTGLPAHGAGRAGQGEWSRAGGGARASWFRAGGCVFGCWGGLWSLPYPLWDGLIGELLDVAAARLPEKQAATCRVLARKSPEEVVSITLQQLGVASYREVLRRVLRGPNFTSEVGAVGGHR